MTPKRLVEIRLVLVSAIIAADVTLAPFLPVAAFPPPGRPALPRPRRLASPAGDSAQSGLAVGDAAAGAQHGMGAGELVGRGADVHAGVVENEIFEVDELALQPQAGAGVGKWVRATQPSRIGLLASRSSSRASASSAAASGPASWAQGSGSGIW